MKLLKKIIVRRYLNSESEQKFNMKVNKSFKVIILDIISFFDNKTYYNNERLTYSLNYKTPVQYKFELGF